MEYHEYLRRIAFRFYQPTMYWKGFTRLNTFLMHTCQISIETLNTVLPGNSKEKRDRLWELLKIPKMSTFAIGAIINEAVAQMKAEECFVNVGVWHGFTLLSGMSGNASQKCIGVDDFSQFGGPKDQFLKRFQQYQSDQHRFYDMDYKAYFAQVHTGPIGVYMYDGAHSYPHQPEGLRIAESFLAKDGIIVIDDTNAQEPRQATLDFMASSRNAYRMLLDQTTCQANHLTFWCGIMVLQKVS